MISDRAIRRAADRFRLAPEPELLRAGGKLQVLLDASLSMTSGDGSKEERLRELALLFLMLGSAAGTASEVWCLRGGERNRLVTQDAPHRLTLVPLDGIDPIFPLPDDVLVTDPVSVRVVLSDFLFRVDPDQLVRQASAGTAALWLIQLLDDWEQHPTPNGLTVLSDVETDEKLELLLDSDVVQSYERGLGDLQRSYAEAALAAGAHWVAAVSSSTLEAVCLDPLVVNGLLVVEGGWSDEHHT